MLNYSDIETKNFMKTIMVVSRKSFYLDKSTVIPFRHLPAVTTAKKILSGQKFLTNDYFKLL